MTYCKSVSNQTQYHNISGTSHKLLTSHYVVGSMTCVKITCRQTKNDPNGTVQAKKKSMYGGNQGGWVVQKKQDFHPLDRVLCESSGLLTLLCFITNILILIGTMVFFSKPKDIAFFAYI